jgi:hypothetical protein
VIPGWPNGATRLSARAVITLLGVKRTLGTETSQYREEEEATARPGVAASGTGRLPKPVGFASPGLKDPRTRGVKSAEVPWNGAPQTVTAR